MPGFDLSAAPDQITDYVVDGDALNHVVQDNRDTIRAGVSGVAGMAGNAIAGPGGGFAASRGTSYATRDAIPQNAGNRIALPDTTPEPEGAWYSPGRWKDEAVHASGYKQHLMPAVTDGIAAKKADLEKKMSDAGC